MTDNQISDHITVLEPNFDTMHTLAREAYIEAAEAICPPGDASYEIFIVRYANLTPEVTAPILGDLDLSSLEMYECDITEDIILCNQNEEVVMHRRLYEQMHERVNKLASICNKVSKLKEGLRV